MIAKCCCHQVSFPSLVSGLLAPGNSEAAVTRLTELLENCRACQNTECQGIGELLIQATVLSALEGCEENATKPGLLDGLLPGPTLAEEG